MSAATEDLRPTTDERTMWTNLAAYCRDQAAKRAAEGRHDRARAWRFEAQQAEAKAAQVERQQLAEINAAWAKAQESGR